MHLSAEMVDSTGAYLLDTGEVIFLYVGRNISPAFLENVLGARSYQSLPDQMVFFVLRKYEIQFLFASSEGFYFHSWSSNYLSWIPMRRRGWKTFWSIFRIVGRIQQSCSLSSKKATWFKGGFSKYTIVLSFLSGFFFVFREDGPIRHLFTAHLVDGRTESSLSYYEFLQHLKNQIK